MVQKVTSEIYKIKVDSNVYVIPSLRLVIDTGPAEFKLKVKREVDKILGVRDVSKIVLTHLHYDHCGNVDVFPNARVYASAEAVRLLHKDPYSAVLDRKTANELVKRGVHALDKLDGFKVINTPGHTTGSFCLLYKDVLFTGDTYFREGVYGRVDLPTSNEALMEKSLSLISKLKYKKLCPGHDY